MLILKQLQNYRESVPLLFYIQNDIWNSLHAEHTNKVIKSTLDGLAKATFSNRYNSVIFAICKWFSSAIVDTFYCARPISRRNSIDIIAMDETGLLCANSRLQVSFEYKIVHQISVESLVFESGRITLSVILDLS